jgi:hypothetical protein
MFIEAQVTIAQVWNQPWCPSANVNEENVIYTNH